MNAGARWSFDGTELLFEARASGAPCGAIFSMAIRGPAPLPIAVSSGLGSSRSPVFLPGDRQVVYASTHLESPDCPLGGRGPGPAVDSSIFALAGYDLFRGPVDGRGLARLTATPGYDAEAAVCAVDGSVVFTSARDGDLELYRMDADGRHVHRLTHAEGYDGGASFDSDCAHIVWHAFRPRPGREQEEYRRLLAAGVVRPPRLEIWMASADGSDPMQVTYLEASSSTPIFIPGEPRIVFSSNLGGAAGPADERDLWAIDASGANLERITTAPGFDGFPAFSPDGRRLAFTSGRTTPKGAHDTNLFIANWGKTTPEKTGRWSGNSPADRVLADVRYLADPAREGRGIGTAGLAAAATYIEARLRRLGLAPAGVERGGYRQPFEVRRRLPTGGDTEQAVETTTAYNIVARLRASCPEAERLPGAVLLGAHYDHLGLGEAHSLEPESHQVHPGADDNASGVATLLEVARTLVARQASLRRDVVLVAFSAEEEGVLGSTEFVRHPPGDLEIGDLVAMVNLDMVGHLRRNHLTVLGRGTAVEWPELLGAACDDAGIDCRTAPSAQGGDESERDGHGYGPSDQLPFLAARIPVAHFFTGLHADYHRPSDTADKLNAAGAGQIATAAASLVGRLTNRAAPLTFVEANPAPTGTGDRRTLRAVPAAVSGPSPEP